MNTIQQALIDSFVKTSPELAEAIKFSHGKGASRSRVEKNMLRIKKIAPLVYDAAMLYIENLYVVKNDAVIIPTHAAELDN